LSESSDDELSLQFETSYEEEDGEQSIRCPRFYRQVQVEGNWADDVVAKVLVGMSKVGVRCDETSNRCQQQQTAADGLLTERFSDESALAARKATEEYAGSGSGHQTSVTSSD